MQDQEARDLEERVEKVRILIKALEERITMVEKDLARIYELQGVFKKCIEANSHGL
ncbi:MAG: hypothetical protein QXX81_00865 [Zestosphaera sp.]